MSFCREGGILPSSPTMELDFCFRLNLSWRAWAAGRYGHFHPSALFISRLSAGQADQEEWASICFLLAVHVMSVVEGQPHKMSSLHITSVLPAAAESLEFLFLEWCRFFGISTVRRCLCWGLSLCVSLLLTAGALGLVRPLHSETRRQWKQVIANLSFRLVGCWGKRALRSPVCCVRSESESDSLLFVF